MSKRPSWRKGIKDSDDSSSSSSNVLSTLKNTVLEQVEELRETDPKKSTVYIFYHTVLEYIKKLHSWYPEVPEFKVFLEEKPTMENFDDVLAEDLAKQFNDKFKASTKQVLEKDLDFLEHQEFLHFQVKEKYEVATDEIRDEFWETFRNLLQFSSMIDMYSNLPNGMMSSITNMAGDMITKLQTGEMDITSLNPMQIGEMMMQNINQDELEKFAVNMLSGGNLENMMSLMQQSLGNSELGGMLDMIKKQNN